MKDGTFADYWREKYPGRKLSTVATYDFDTHMAVVAVYFEKIVEQVSSFYISIVFVRFKQIGYIVL